MPPRVFERHTDHVRELFDNLVQCDPDGRRQALNKVGHDDPDLRMQLEALLAAEEHSHALLTELGAKPESSASAWDRIETIFDSACREASDPLVVVENAGIEDTDTRLGLASLLRRYVNQAALQRSSPETGSSPVKSSARPGGAVEGAHDALVGSTVSHYRILARLGEGGMGVVYRARDLRLPRDVALKFLSRDLISDETAKLRFTQEAMAASALDHPNICTIYEIDEFDDRMFIAMACYEGATLKEQIRGGPLVAKEVVEVAGQLAGGIAAAHAAEIIHRDVKPANVFLTESGIVKILDFGIAKIRGVRITSPGSRIGTIAYMSPEQIRGEDVDERTDIWSLGVVLYEMLTGRLPFEGTYPEAVAYCILHEEIPAPRDIVGGIPDGICGVVMKALEKRSAHRYASMGEFADAIASSLAPRRSRTQTSRERRQEISLIVLPFDNISDDPSKSYLSLGLTEEIIADLSGIRALQVISRTSSVLIKEMGKDVQTIGKEFNVDYVLEGSVRTLGDRLRITAQLIDTVTDAHIWADKFTGSLHDLFEMQEQVARSIADALQIRLTADEGRWIGEQSIQSLPAYECYLRARHAILGWTKDGLDQACRHLQHGLDIVGANTLLYSGMGFVHLQYLNAGFSDSQEHLAEAEKYARRIFSLKEDSPHGHRLYGLIYALRGEQNAAIRHLKEALTADRNDPDALLTLTLIYGAVGLTEEADPLAERLVQIDPLTPMTYWIRGWIYWTQGRLEDAAAHIRRMYELDESQPAGPFLYVAILSHLQRPDDVARVVREMETRWPDHPLTVFGRFLHHVAADRKEEALAEFTPMLDARGDWFDSWLLAGCFARIGEPDRSLHFLRQSTERGFVNYPFLSSIDTSLQSLRGDDRYENIMASVKKKCQAFRVSHGRTEVTNLSRVSGAHE